MRLDPPDTHFFADLRELNRQFLALLNHPEAGEESWRLLDIDAGVASAIRQLTPEELGFMAGVPGLLAEFACLPPVSAVAELPAPGVASAWLESARVFAAALLTYLWQLSRRDPLASALCLGLDDGRRGELGRMQFRDIHHGAAVAAGQLRVRYGRHPRLWPELLRAARSRDLQLRDLCRLDLIPLGLAPAGPREAPRERRRRAAR